MVLCDCTLTVSALAKVTVIDAAWKEIEYDESLVRQMDMASLATSSSKQVEEESSLHETADQSTTPSTGDSVPESASFRNRMEG